MNELLLILKKRMEQGKSSVLVTITETSGSIPRTTGAYLLVGKNGVVYGTVGGGTLEYLAILHGQELLKKQKSDYCSYDLNQESKDKLGMVCGGKVKLLFHFLNKNMEQDTILKALRLNSKNESYFMMFPLDHGNIKVKKKLVVSKKHSIMKYKKSNYYVEQFGYDGRVFFFGGGTLTRETVPVLLHLGFRCIVMDDRREYLKKKQFPGVETYLIDFYNMKNTVPYEINQNDYVIIMTRGHIFDKEVESFILKTKASYIGVVGSRKKTLYVNQQLLKEGFLQRDLDRVTTPIGLPIHSETPEEIAISIAAQLVKVRAEKYKKDY